MPCAEYGGTPPPSNSSLCFFAPESYPFEAANVNKLPGLTFTSSDSERHATPQNGIKWNAGQLLPHLRRPDADCPFWLWEGRSPTLPTTLFLRILCRQCRHPFIEHVRSACAWNNWFRMPGATFRAVDVATYADRRRLARTVPSVAVLLHGTALMRIAFRVASCILWVVHVQVGTWIRHISRGTLWSTPLRVQASAGCGFRTCGSCLVKGAPAHPFNS